MTNKFLMLVEIATDHPDVDSSRMDFIRSGVRRILTWGALNVWDGNLFKASSVRITHCQALPEDEDGASPQSHAPPLLGDRAVAWLIEHEWEARDYDPSYDEYHSCCPECGGWRPGGSTRRKDTANCFGHAKSCTLAAMIAEAKAQVATPVAAAE